MSIFKDFAAIARLAPLLRLPRCRRRSRAVCIGWRQGRGLQCQVGVGVGLIIVEKEKLVCTFHPNVGPVENYHGYVRKFGLEVGVTAGSIIVWAVIAATNDYAPGSLAGHYGGVSADITAGLGVGANALVGGSNKSLALQPLSVQGQAGIDIGLGISELVLEPR